MLRNMGKVERNSMKFIVKKHIEPINFSTTQMMAWPQ